MRVRELALERAELRRKRADRLLRFDAVGDLRFALEHRRLELALELVRSDGVATHCTLLQHGVRSRNVLRRVALGCNVLHWAASCCTGLRRVVVDFNVLYWAAMCCTALQRVALGCNVLHCVAERELMLSHRRLVRSPAVLPIGTVRHGTVPPCSE